MVVHIFCKLPLTNETKNTPRGKHFRVMYGSIFLSSGRHVLLRPKQNCVGYMIDLRTNLSDPGNLVLDSCAEAMAMAVHVCFCLTGPGFVGGEKDGDCAKEALLGLVKVCGWQLFSFESKLIANEEICNASRESSVEMDGIQALRQEDIWSASTGLPPLKSFFPHLLHCLSFYHQNVCSFKVATICH